VTKLLGIFSSKRLFSDWKVAEPDDSKRAKVTWKYFVTTMQQHYKPTKNRILKNHQFRSLAQDAHESFPTFCNRVYKAAQHCNFKCHNDDCTAEDTAIRDQIIIGTTHDKIREEALKIHGTSNNYARKECELKVPPKDWKSSTMKIQPLNG
jgi:hypothetical protein